MDDDLEFAVGNSFATLTGNLLDGTAFTGTGDICITQAHVDPEAYMTVNATEPFQDDAVVFTIEALNNGPSNATQVEFTDILPAGLTFVSYSLDAGSFDSTTGVWTIGDLLVDQIVTLNITAIVDAPAGTTMAVLRLTWKILM